MPSGMMQAVIGGTLCGNGRRRRALRAGAATLAFLIVGVGCTDEPDRTMTPLADVVAGGVSVHVALDDAGNPCSSVGEGLPVCLAIGAEAGVGILDAHLDQEPGAPLLMRVLVDPDTQFVGLPEGSTRVPIDERRVLLLAATTLSIVCFTYTKPDGTPGTVEIHQTQVDTGSGVTTGAQAETGCAS